MSTSSKVICSEIKWFYRLLAVLVFGIFVGDLDATTYYVSPDGDDSSPGTEEEPWRTAGHAGREARAGETVVFLPGDYTDPLVPKHSGTTEAPIEFRSLKRGTARLVGHNEGEWGNEGEGARIRLHDVTHVNIRGFEVRDTAEERSEGGWLHIRGSSDILVAECAFWEGRRWQSFSVRRAERIRVVDNDFKRATHSGDMFTFRDVRQILIEGNSFTRDLHSMAGVRDGHQIVIRGNVFHSGWSRNGSIYNCSEVLVENNIFANAFNGSWSAGSMARHVGDQIIMRFNQTYRSYGIPFSRESVDVHELTHTNERNYHNVYYGNHGAALVCFSHKRYFNGAIIKNNIFAGNDPHGSGTHLIVTGGAPSAIQVSHNAFFSGELDWPSLLLYEKTALSIMKAQGETPGFEGNPVFGDNIEVDPRFEDPGRYNFALLEDSPLRDNAAPLTTTRGSGEGRELPVRDAYFFYDGYGIPGERGDLIAVGSSENRARVIEANRSRGILHLDREIEWEAGAPVDFPWSGVRSDFGPFEHGGEGRPTVQIVADRVRITPGESVTLRALVRGWQSPVKYDWQLGDGNYADGESVTHTYNEARDFGIRVRVSDGDGESLVGVGYVSAEPVPSEGVLIHTTFDSDDTEWWKKWQFYRGRRGTGYADYEHILDEETGKGYHRISALDGTGPLPAFLHPRNWNIDRYPNVRIRYRIRPGTPVAIFVRPFPSAYHPKENFDMREDTRRYYFAGTEGEPQGEQTLIDDGEWHEITFDVRDIRRKFPDVQVLQAINIGDLEIDGGAEVGPDDEFWLDEIYIGK